MKKKAGIGMKMDVRTGLEAAGINCVTGLERFVGNDALFIDFLKKFPDDPSYGRMEEELKKDNCEGAFKAAHTLKGVTSNLSMDALHYKLQPLVEALRTGKLEEAKDYFKGVEEAYEKAVATILQLEKM